MIIDLTRDELRQLERLITEAEGRFPDARHSAGATIMAAMVALDLTDAVRALVALAADESEGYGEESEPHMDAKWRRETLDARLNAILQPIGAKVRRDEARVEVILASDASR